MDTQTLLESLLRTTLFLTASGLLCHLALRKTGDRIPRLSRFLWIAVLLTGWFWIRPAVSIPWKETVRKATPVVAVTTEMEPSPVFHQQIVRHFETATNPAPVVVVLDESAIVSKAIRWKPLISKTVLAVWLGGMAASIFLAAAGYVRFLSLLRKTVPADDDFAGPWRRLLEEHGIDARSIPMFVSSGRHDLGPALVRTMGGYRLVIPRELWSELPESGRRGILKHELEHFRRRDVWKSFFVRILSLPHWFNPAAHLAVHRFEEAAELLCDRAAFECRQGDVLEFARTLLLLHENAPTQFTPRPSIFGRGLKHRVACLLHENQDKKVSTMKKIFLVAGAVVISSACLFRFEFAEKIVAQNMKTENKAASTDDPQETVELRLKVVGYENNEEKDPLPNVEIGLQYGFNDQYLHRWKTGFDGVGVTRIPLAAANPENQLYLRGTEKDMTQGASLWNIPQDWTPSQPLAMTISIHRKPRRFTGTVVDSAGKPVEEALIGSDFAHFMQWAETDEKGVFEYYCMNDPIESLFAVKEGVGAAVISPDYEKAEDRWKAMSPDGREEWKKQEKHNDGPFTFKLEKGEPITVRVVNPEGNPIEGISVAPTSFSTDYRYTKEAWSWNAWNVARFWSKKTDANGMVRFDSIPTDGYDIICFDAWGTDPRFDKDKKTSRYGKGGAVWRSREKNNDLVISMRRQVMLEGSVRNADGSPSPVAMQISFVGKKWANCGTNTDYAGNFTFFVNADEIVSVYPISNDRRNPGVGVAKALLNVDVGDGSKPAPRFDFVLDKGTKVAGKIVADKPEKPFEKMYVQIFDVAFDRKIELTEMNRLFAVVDVNDKGEFETRLADGVYRFKVDKEEIDGTLEIKGEDEKRFDLKL